MDIFKFNTNPSTPTKLESGEIINGLRSKEWIDRYREAGEFTLTSHASADIRKKLPEGTMIGMIGNPGIMIVEDHALSDDDEDSVVTTTGRSFETVFEQRVVKNNLKPTPTEGDPYPYPTSGGMVEPVLYGSPDGDPETPPEEAWVSWLTAKSMLIRHTYDSYCQDPNDDIPYLEVVDSVLMDPDDATRQLWEINRTYLYSEIVKILETDNIGWRVMRPGPWSPAANPENIAVVLYDGIDRRNDVIMSYESGEVESADYLWSIRNYKNVAHVYGKWIELQVGDLAASGINKRVLVVDGTEIDDRFEAEPTAGSRTRIIYAMQSLGRKALAEHRKIALSGVNLRKNAQEHIYGKDYDLGDIITVRGNYVSAKPMRVTEYVHIEDENGYVGYPTLSDLETEF